MSARPDASARTRRGTDRLLVAAGASYVLARLEGLVAAPARPTATGDAVLTDFLLENRGPLLVQSVLVHGVAGAALLVVAVGAGRALASRGSTAAGGVAAALSSAQVALLAAAVVSAGRRPDGTAAAPLAALDGVDAAKLLARAGFAVASSRAGRRSALLPKWARVLGALPAGSLVLGAASFLPGLGDPLGPVLFAALPVLLVYVAAVAVFAARGRVPAHGEEASRRGHRWCAGRWRSGGWTSAPCWPWP